MFQEHPPAPRGLHGILCELWWCRGAWVWSVLTVKCHEPGVSPTGPSVEELKHLHGGRVTVTGRGRARVSDFSSLLGCSPQGDSRLPHVSPPPTWSGTLNTVDQGTPQPVCV